MEVHTGKGSNCYSMSLRTNRQRETREKKVIFTYEGKYTDVYYQYCFIKKIKKDKCLDALTVQHILTRDQGSCWVRYKYASGVNISGATTLHVSFTSGKKIFAAYLPSLCCSKASE